MGRYEPSSPFTKELYGSPSKGLLLNLKTLAGFLKCLFSLFCCHGRAENTYVGGSITVRLVSCLTGLDLVALVVHTNSKKLDWRPAIE